MRLTSFEEYPHETALRRKREAAVALYEACAAFLVRADCGERADTPYVASMMRAAVALADGETPSDTLGEKA